MFFSKTDQLFTDALVCLILVTKCYLQFMSNKLPLSVDGVFELMVFSFEKNHNRVSAIAIKHVSVETSFIHLKKKYKTTQSLMCLTL